MGKINYKLSIAMAVVGLVSLLNAAAQVQVKGKVTSAEDDSGLPGVTVLQKGTTNGVITDLDGNYTTTAKDGDILIFSFVGFKNQEITFRGETQLNVSMELDIQALSEVVVMGYSEKSQKELSASVVSLDTKDLQNVTSPNVQTMLQGKVPGLTVSSPSGQPGAVADIRIRGITSLNADKPPLFVVDGMIGGNFVPSDVESITVLKDAAAIGLYGAAGAAGVIIVTTKTAKRGKPVISYSGRYGLKEAAPGNFAMMNSEELYEAQRGMWGDANLVSFLNNRPESLENQDFDWYNAAFQRAAIQNHSISMRGAGEDIRYNFSVDYFDEEGTFVNTHYERLNLRGGIQFSPTKNFSVQTDINAQFSTDKTNHYSWFEDAYWNLPWDQPTHEENGATVTSGPVYVTNSVNGWIGQFKRNFLHSVKYNELGSTNEDINWSTRTSLKLTDWLSVETRTRLNSYNWAFEEYYAPNTDQGISNNGVVGRSSGDGWGVLSTHFLRFNYELGEHEFGAFVAHEGSYSTANESSIRGINLSTNTIDVLDGASNVQGESGGKGFSGSDIQYTGISFISELSYGFRQKYFATAYYRIDGSSVFAENSRYGYFPGGSVAWLISEESALAGISSLDLLKVRASYGLTGNSNVPPFLSLPTYNITRQYNGQPGAEPNNPANPDLQWETTKMLNAGIDIALFSGLSVSVDVYQKTVEGMLLTNPLAFSTGYESRIENIGDMQNQGIEFMTSYTKTFGDFTYNGSFNISYNKNEITKITDVLDEQPITAGAIQQTNKVGNQAFMWYMPKWMGVNPDDGTPQWEVLQYDADGNVTGSELTGAYNEATFQPIESALPEVTGGLNNSVSYKGFALSFLFTFQTGNHIYHGTRSAVDSDGANTGINLMKLQDGWTRWENPGDNATHPRLNRGGNNGAHLTSSRYIEKGDFLRLRNVNLSYSLPKRLTDWGGIKGVVLSVSADNMMTWTDFSGVDPDIGLQVQAFSLPGLSNLKYPISKQLIFGLNINF